jgi:hypothetical protein
MQRMVELEGRDIVLDTENDTGVFLAPRPVSEDDRRYGRGRDLFIKNREERPDIYSLSRWTEIPGEEEKITIVTRNIAERFLEEHGLILANYPEERAGNRLSNPNTSPLNILFWCKGQRLQMGSEEPVELYCSLSLCYGIHCAV